MIRTLSLAWWPACALAFIVMAGCSDEPTAEIRSPEYTSADFSPTGQIVKSLPMAGRTDRVEPGRLTGLSSNLSSGVSNAFHDPFGIEADTESLPPDLGDPILANQTYSTPFPDRTDPFEFGNGVEFDNQQSRETGAQNIQLYGFAGAEHPKAIIHIDGATKMLGVGEKWGVVEVLEVSPPTVRIKSNGVARVWSLLGHHAQTGL